MKNNGSKRYPSLRKTIADNRTNVDGPLLSPITEEEAENRTSKPATKEEGRPKIAEVMVAVNQYEEENEVEDLDDMTTFNLKSLRERVTALESNNDSARIRTLIDISLKVSLARVETKIKDGENRVENLISAGNTRMNETIYRNGKIEGTKGRS